jgi:hypothetical protein
MLPEQPQQQERGAVVPAPSSPGRCRGGRGDGGGERRSSSSRCPPSRSSSSGSSAATDHRRRRRALYSPGNRAGNNGKEARRRGGDGWMDGSACTTLYYPGYTQKWRHMSSANGPFILGRGRTTDGCWHAHGPDGALTPTHYRRGIDLRASAPPPSMMKCRPPGLLRSWVSEQKQEDRTRTDRPRFAERPQATTTQKSGTTKGSQKPLWVSNM